LASIVKSILRYGLEVVRQSSKPMISFDTKDYDADAMRAVCDKYRVQLEWVFK